MFQRFDEILPIFFAAMIEGYAAGSFQKSTIVDLPGSKIFVFEKDGFTVKDCYYSSEQMNGFSFGSTIIWCENMPIWVMSYQGRYKKSAIPFLKKALLENYGVKPKPVFLGGRGPYTFKVDDFIYLNHPEMPNDWKSFRGREEICISGHNVGWHEYQGKLVVPISYSEWFSQ